MVIADEESKYLWDFFDKSKLEGVDFALMIRFMNLKACEF